MARTKKPPPPAPTRQEQMEAADAEMIEAYYKMPISMESAWQWPMSEFRTWRVFLDEDSLFEFCFNRQRQPASLMLIGMVPWEYPEIKSEDLFRKVWYDITISIPNPQSRVPSLIKCAIKLLNAAMKDSDPLWWTRTEQRIVLDSGIVSRYPLYEEVRIATREKLRREMQGFADGGSPKQDKADERNL